MRQPKPFYRRPIYTLLSGLVLWLAQATVWAVASAEDADFVCGGKLEAQVWQLWDGTARDYLQTQQLTKRLIEQGDVYALYDIQTFIHNLAAMARRCQRRDRLEQFADLLGSAYLKLESNPDSQASLAWICRGGAICNNTNRLLNHEVMLDSVQFLALTASVANGLVAFAPQRNPSPFVEQTVIASIQHLLRWGNMDAMRQLDKQLTARWQDVKDGSSALFFTDKPLWMISVYADLAGLLQRQPALRAKSSLTDHQLLMMQKHLSLLLRLFSARIIIMDDIGRNKQKVKTADLDRGFFRLYADNKYAGYTSNKKPVACVPQPDGPPRIQVMLDADTLAKIKPVDNLGWDISHARRLVHAFDAIERNRQAMREVFGVEETTLPSPAIIEAFAQQLIVKVWNGDIQHPLFSNYWSGANGWYRVAYDNGTPRCMEGHPPFGLSDSFPTGGYASWARYVPEIRTLGRRLYELSRASDEASRNFMDQYYPGLGGKASTGRRMLNELMFWPSLVETSRE